VHLLRGEEHGAVLELDGGVERKLRRPNHASEVAH
jgi:hypothetical protein